MKKLLLVLIASIPTLLFAQNKSELWSAVFEKQIAQSGERVIIPQKYKTFHLEGNDLKALLYSAPHEKNVALKNSQHIIDLPYPDGSFKKFRVIESPVMSPELQAQFPDIKTFNVMGVDEPGTYGKLDWTEFGFHGMLRRIEGDIFIDPYCRNNTSDYISYFTGDFVKDPSQVLPEVGVIDERVKDEHNGYKMQATICAGTNLRTYRFAVACTGEYAQAATGLTNPTTAQILSVVTTTVNRVDGVYETEVAVKLILVANETTILYGNPSTDPFTGNNNANTLINESQTVITNNIGSANFDIGHTFSTGGGGLAGLGVVCTNSQKARGITGSPNPVGDPYDIDYVAHEVGHEFSGDHSFSANTGSCSGNGNLATSMEPGSGVTIMAYAGICGASDNIANNSIAYFHTVNFDEIMTFTNTGSGNSCAVITSTGNSAPVVNAGSSFTVPKSTPFTLTGSATDADGDPLTYSWEENDPAASFHSLPSTTAKPFFRSFVPVTSPSRMFPKLATVQSGATTALGEYLPTTAQTLNFRLTARDNKMGGGGVCYSSATVTVATSGPFAVTYPDATGITWASSSTQTVTWSVNSTNTAPVSCANVNILLSTDGGVTWSMVLANTPNDGTQAITVPPQATTKTTCRIKVEAVGNIFFDISNNNFTITATTSPIAGVSISQTGGTNPMCPGASATFTATPTNGGSSPSYQWQVNGSNVGTNSTTYTTTTLTNGQQVTCIMTSNLSGVVGNPATSNTITMVVGSTTPSVSINGDSVLCVGSSVTFTATPVNGGTSPSYQWLVNGSNAGTNSATFTTSTLTNGQTVSCVMTSNAGCQTTSTATSNTITVVVNSSASLPFVENFEATTFPPTGWVVENADAPSIAWGTAGAKGIERRAAAGNTGSTAGSAALNCYDYNTDTTQVDNLISKPVNLSGVGTARMTFKRAYKYYNDGTSPNNYHDELKIYISTDCGGTYGSYVYFKKGKKLATNGTTNATFTPAVAADWDIDTVDLTAYVNQSVIVKFEYINRYGNNLYIDDINITGTAAPVASVSIAQTSGTNPMCAGASATFTATPTNGGSAPAYQWQVNGSNVGTNSTTYTTTGLTNGQIVTCIMTSNLAGVTNNPDTSNAITMTVNSSVTPAVSITGNSSICAGTSTTFTATPTNGGTAPSYQWKVNGSNVGTNSATYTSSTLTNGQTVTCTLTSNAACASPVTATSNTITMTVTPSVTPSVSISGNSTICAGTSTTFTATPTNGGTAPSYQWKVNGSNVGTNAATYTTSTLTNGQTVTCTITSNATCASPATANSNTITMTVNPAVTPSVSISGNNTICPGSSTTFTATPTNGGSSPSYQWQVDGSNAGTNSATFTSSTLTNGQVVTCILTSNATCASTSTANSNAITMSVTSTVTPSISISGNNNICSGTSTTFTATPTNGGSTPAYQWQVNGANVGTNSASYTSSALTNGQTVTCILTSNASCASPSAATSNTITMTVTPGVTPSVSISGNNTICAGSSTTFTATPTNGGSTPAYQWQVNGSNVGTNSSAFTSSALTNGQTVTCILTSNATCASSTTANSNTITMTVTSNVTPSVTISGSNTICSGSSTTFSATATNGGSSPSYQWQVDGSNVGTNSASYTSSALTNGQTVSCILTSNASCASSTTANSNTITMTVSSSVTPAISISQSGGNNPMCAGDAASFDATATNGGSAPSYQWQINGNNAGTNSAAFSSSGLTNGDVITCVLTSNASCASQANANSNSITMTVNPVPAMPTITQNGDTLTSDSPNGNQWYFNGAAIAGATSQTYVCTQSGNYTVVVTQNGCSSPSSAPQAVTIIGIKTTLNGTSFNVYPNPNNGQFTISFEISQKANYVLELKNVLGQVIYSEKLNGFAGSYTKQMNVSAYSQGIYLLSISSSDKELVKKVIVY